MPRRRRSPSSTAAYFACFRAAEAERPDDDRLFDDPLARHFVPRLARIVPPRVIVRVADAMFAGIATYGICRSRVAEDAMRTTTASQVVLFGSGFETVTWRVGREELRIFEVDTTATQQAKRRRLAKAGLSLPANVHLIEADLDDKGWLAELREGGYRRTEKTLFLALGLFMYLDTASVDEIVHHVATCAPGSRLVFDVVPPDVVAGRSGLRGARLGTLLVALRGEKFRSGVESREIGSFLSVRGLRLVESLDAASLYARFRREPLPDYVLLVTAEVAERSRSTRAT
ncbi:MAG: class I SAM-dependent methyltransferase [Planctomycetes bacterium]|nr:class I SAM-dependent methyltransferase [Planctomycetota bacterium]MBI3845591.1 class I SAM-dependent methyltransferase [Planctomycetota bacterium]